MPDIYRDDSDPNLLLAIFNADPTQQLSLDTSRFRAVSAHRFRQILITPTSLGASSEEPLSLMPMLTFTEDAQGGTTCRPQVIARLRRRDANFPAEETDLLTRFLEVWSDTLGSRSTTIKAETGGAILAAIQDVELLAARVSHIYSGEATIYDSDNAADQGAFKDEWYGTQRYLRCTSPKTFALTDLTRPVGIFSDNRLKYLDILYTVSNVETETVSIHTSSKPNYRSVGQKVLYSYIATSARSAPIVTFLEGILNCNADVDAPNSSGSSAMLERQRTSEGTSTGAEERGPLHVPLNRLSEKCDTIQDLFTKETEKVVDIGIPIFNDALRQAKMPILNTTTVLRPQLRPVNLLHLRNADVFPYLTDKALSFFVV